MCQHFKTCRSSKWSARFLISGSSVMTVTVIFGLQGIWNYECMPQCMSCAKQISFPSENNPVFTRIVLKSAASSHKITKKNQVLSCICVKNKKKIFSQEIDFLCWHKLKIKFDILGQNKSSHPWKEFNMRVYPCKKGILYIYRLLVNIKCEVTPFLL